MGSGSSKIEERNITSTPNQVKEENINQTQTQIKEENIIPTPIPLQESIQSPDIIPENNNSYDSKIFWIDKNLNNEETKLYIDCLKKIKKFTVLPFETIESAYAEIKKIRFEDTYIILSGSFYQKFILTFKKNLKTFYVIPKFIIFTWNKNIFLENNKNIKNIIEDSFYNLGGIQTYFDEIIYDFLTKKKWKKVFNVKNNNLRKNKEKQFTFEYIDCIEKLYLPSYFKSLIEVNNEDNFDELTQYLYNSYSNKKDIKELLGPIEGIPKVPVEILCKYFARLYTIESEFYVNLNQSLRESNFFSGAGSDYYSTIFIKSFYEGIKLGSFHIGFKDDLLRFSYLEKNEFELVKKCLRNKKQNLPGAICFSKTFLSFSEGKEKERITETFFNIAEFEREKNKDLIPVFFHLKYKEVIKESFITHIDIQDISFHQDENEILFFPFSCFEVISVNNYKGINNIYEIELSYLGKYDDNLRKMQTEIEIPDSAFGRSLKESGFVEKSKITNISNKKIINEYNKYENIFVKNNDIIYIICSVKKEDIDENGYVSIFGKNEKGNDFVKANKTKIKLLINNEEKNLEYKFKLKEGENKIRFLIKDYEINNLEYMFYNCSSLKNIEGLKYFDVKNVNNFTYMFSGCESLSDITALENWNVSHGNNFSDMFSGCKSLSDITALKNWNVSNGNNFSSMFSGCESLSDIIALNNWKVSNGNNFSFMFKGCEKLSDITALKNWKVSNGNNYLYIFSGCKQLSDITALKNWDVSKANNFSHMFSVCLSLKDITTLKNWAVSNCNNFSYMFKGCESLSDIKALEFWDVSKGNDFSNMFSGCKNLSDIRALKKWTVSKGNNFSYMFSGCKYLSDIKILDNWIVSNGNNFSYMFYGCEKLPDIKAIKKWDVSNGNNFSSMFAGCISIKDLNPITNWKVSKGNNFSSMFSVCESLTDITALKNWNVSNGNNFSYMFSACELLTEIKALENWDVSNGNDFSYMFSGCKYLSDITALEKWNVSNGNNFSHMFSRCKFLSDITALEKWKASNGSNFAHMFDGCESLMDKSPFDKLKNQS